jgi:hypothetical protein
VAFSAQIHREIQSLAAIHERNHQGLGNRLILPEGAPAKAGGTVKCRERLGGMLNYYYRAA